MTGSLLAWAGSNSEGEAELYLGHARKEHVIVIEVLNNVRPDRIDTVFTRYHALPLGEE